MSLPTYLLTLDVGVKFLILNSMIMPLPFNTRKAYMRFLMTNGYVAKFVYFLKIVSIFIAVLFVDAARTAYIIELKPEAEGFNSGLDGGDMAVTASSGTSARKLLAERNMILTSCSLFTSFMIWRIFELNMENVKFGEEVHKLKGQDTGPAIDDHRDTFKQNYDKNKPNHEAAARKRALQTKDVPVPEDDSTVDATTTRP